MATARQHHYIPQFYLRGFARKPHKKAKLHVFDMHKSVWLPHPTIVKNLGTARDFNRVDIEGHPPDALENSLARFETEVASILKRICEQRQRPEGEEFVCLMNLAALMSVRNPSVRENFRNAQKKVIEIITDLTLATKERYESSIKRMKEAGHGVDLPEVSYEEMLRFHEEGNYEINIPNQRFFPGEFNAVDTVIKSLLARKWLFIISPDSAGHFICSDHPVRLRWTDPKLAEGFYPPGHAMGSTEIIFPVSKDLALVGTFEGEDKTITADRYLIAMINTLTLEGCKRHLYATRNNFDFIGPNREILGPKDIPRIFKRMS